MISQKFIWGQDKRKKKMVLTSKVKEGNESKNPFISLDRTAALEF